MNYNETKNKLYEQTGTPGSSQGANAGKGKSAANYDAMRNSLYRDIGVKTPKRYTQKSYRAADFEAARGRAALWERQFRNVVEDMAQNGATEESRKRFEYLQSTYLDIAQSLSWNDIKPFSQLGESMTRVRQFLDHNDLASQQTEATPGAPARRQGIAVDLARERTGGLTDYRQTPALHGGSGAQRQSLTAAQLQQEIDALQKQIDEMEYDWTDYAQRSAAEKQAADLQRQIDQKEQYLRLAEREEAIAAYDSNRDDPAFQEYVDKGKSGTYSRKEDPLGYYLENRDMLELQSAIGGAPDSNLRKLKNEEQEMYYYLLGSQGSKAAKKYLDDMQLLLDQRVHDEAQANIQRAYQNAGWAGKAGLNAMSVPANVFGGITAPIGDVASVLSGKGYNPYNEGHSLQDFSSLVRGLTSQDIILSLESDEVKNMRAEYAQLEQKHIKAVFGVLELSDEEYRQMATRELELQEALEKVEAPFWGKLAANTYQAVMSGADSALGAALFQNGYTAIMGAGTASQRARELWEAGASDAQIGMGAMASGLIEMATEKYSVEYFTKHFLEGDITGFKDWMIKTLIQGSNEASEEMASELANMAADAMILGANSDNQREIRELMAVEGLSREEAEKKAFVNRALDVLWAGYGGFVSGGAMGGIGGPLNMAVQSQNYQSLYGDSSAELVQQGLKSPEGSESHSLAQEYQQKLDGGKKLTGSEIRKMVQANEAQIRTGNLENDGFYVEQNSERGTTEVTFAQKPDTAVQTALKENGFKWSKKSGKWFTSASQEQARQIVREVMGFDSGAQDTPDSAVQAETDAQGKPDRNDAVQSRIGLQTDKTSDAERFTAASEASGADSSVREKESDVVREDMPFEVSPAEGKTTLNLQDGSTVDTEIIDIASSEKGNLMLNVAGQSEPVRADSISYASTDEALLYHAINSMDLMPAAARELVKLAHSADGSGGELAFQVKQMYTLGENGVPLAKAKSSIYGEKLNDAMKEFGYYLGRRVYDANVQKAEAQKKTVAAAQRARAASTGQKLGGVQYDGITATRGKDGSVAIDGVTLNDQQKAGIAAAEMLAAMGVNIHIFQSRTDASGKPVGENGCYRLSDGSIHIDLNAGNDGQGVMAYTIAHEFTHFMEQQSPAMFQKFTDCLFEALETDVAARIYDKADALKRQHPDIYRNASREKLMADARSEVVAEACETMLTDTDAAGRIGQKLADQDRTLFEKIRQWFRDLAGKLREAYKGLKPDSKIAQNAKETIQQVDDLVQLWADMAVDAAENYRTAETAENEKSTANEVAEKYSIRETEDGRYVATVDSDILSSLDTSVWNKETKRKAQAAASEALKKFSDGIIVNGITRLVNRTSRREYTRSKDTDHLFRNNTEAFADKMRAANVADDVVVAATNWNRDGGLTHPRTDNFVDFDHGETLIMSGSAKYSAEVVVGITSDGTAVFYDVVDMKPVNFEIKNSEPHSTATTNESIGDINGGSDGLNVPQEQTIVKEKFSLRDSEVGENSAGRDIESDLYNAGVKYSYESLVSKPDMPITTLSANVPSSRADVVYQAKQNARKIGTFNIKDGSVSVFVKDIGKDVVLTTGGLRHGLDRRFSINAPVTLKIGEILQNSIRINEMNPSKETASESYVLIGTASSVDGQLYVVRSVVNRFSNEVSSVDVLYAINAKTDANKNWNRAGDNPQGSRPNDRFLTDSTISITEPQSNVNEINAKKGNRLRSMRPGFQGPVTDSTISIAKLLDYVNEYFPDILPESVLKHFGHDARPAGKLGESALYSDRYSTEAAPERQNEKLKAEVSDIRKQWDEEVKAVREKMKLESEWELAEVIHRYQESRKRSVNSRQRTEGRHKVQNIVNTLNKLLLSPEKKNHVPTELQTAVATALDAVNMDTVNAAGRIQELQTKLSEARTDKQREEISRQLYRLMDIGGRMDKKLTELAQAYSKIVNSDDPEISGAFDEVIANKIMEVVEKIGDTPLREMSLEQLKMVYDMYKAVLTRVRDCNKAFAAGQKQRISDIAGRVAAELKEKPELPKTQDLKKRGIKQFFWNNEKPIYAFQRIGSGTLTGLYQNLRNGEDTWARDVNEAKEYFQMAARKYGFQSWDMEKSFEFEAASGKKFRLNISQIMSLYAYSRRPKAAEHIRIGGIVFDERTELSVKNNLGFTKKVNVSDATAYNISDATLLEIIGKLSAEQKAFAEAMQKYLSVTMGGKGNEVSVKLYDLKLFGEENYWPLKSSHEYMQKAKEQQENPNNKLKNAGMTKETKPHASNPIVLSGFMETWTDHVNEMSMYHAFVLPMEDFYRVYNWQVGMDATNETESMQSILTNHVGREAVSYIDQLLKDLNGGVRPDPRETVTKNMISKFKKASVLTSASVVVQQPSAVGRAFAYVEPKYFSGGNPSGNQKQGKVWEECKRYAPVAAIKEMGMFDTDMGRRTADYITAADYDGTWKKIKALATDGNYRDEVFGWAAGKADEVTWCAIWNACKRKVAAEQGLAGEAMLHAAGTLFTEVITKTQVYDSVFSRSANMRSKSSMMNMVTSFMAEPTTSINMLEDAMHRLENGDKTGAAKIAGSVVVSTLINSLLSAFVYAARDDDEDKTFLEKYLSRAATGFLDDINPVTMVPILRDVWSILQGYDVERSDMSLLSDVISTGNSLAGLAFKGGSDMDEDEQAEYLRRWTELGMKMVDGVSSLFGIPEKNIRRDVNAVINLFQKTNWLDSSANTVWYAVWNDVKDTLPIVRMIPHDSKSDTLYRACVSSDPVFRERAAGAYDSAQKLDSALKKGLRDNDPRVRAAAKAMNDGNAAERIRITKEIVAEKHFDQDIVIAAIYAEASSMRERTSSEYKRNIESIYTADDYARAAANGSNDMDSIREDLIRVKVANGATQENAKKSVSTNVKNAVQELFEAGSFSCLEAEQALVNSGVADSDGAGTYISRWEFEMEYPDAPGWSTKGDVAAFIEGLPISNREKRKLWDSVKGTWKDRDTPWE